jgi:ornithine carbamoyltransferase
MSKRDLLSFTDMTRAEMEGILRLAQRLKQEQKNGFTNRVLGGKTLALLFEKPSLRTRVTFEVGMAQLGGATVFLTSGEVGLGTRETPADCARSLSRWVDLITVRTFSQNTLEEMASFASVPVINALTDLYHPCQVLADCLTLLEHKRKLAGLKIVFIGDGNNMVHSWMEAAEKIPFSFTAACPKGYEPKKEIEARAKKNGAQVLVTHLPKEAVRGADVIYTDVWASMGQEWDAATRVKAFQDYQVNERIVALAKKDAVVMHCLPAHRGQEITEGVIESPRCLAFDQAENRLHVQKAIMVWLLKPLEGSMAQLSKEPAPREKNSKGSRASRKGR